MAALAQVVAGEVDVLIVAKLALVEVGTVEASVAGLVLMTGPIRANRWLAGIRRSTAL
jgi:hypothetical protein